MRKLNAAAVSAPSNFIRDTEVKLARIPIDGWRWFSANSAEAKRPARKWPNRQRLTRSYLPLVFQLAFSAFWPPFGRI